MKLKLTKRSVESARPGARDTFLWDTEVSGFGCKITPAGSRVLILQYWTSGRARRLTLGRFGSDLTVDQARNRARRLRGQIADGIDPSAERAASRAMPTLATFAERYLTDHAEVKKKVSSVEADRRNLRLHVLPALGKLRVDAITRADVARLHAAMKDTPGAANRCRQLLSKMFALAEAWNLRPDGSNPCRHVELYPERKMERFLSTTEQARLGAVLAAAADAGEHPSAVAAIRLLVFTGCRRDEIMTLKWEHVDIERRCLNLPDSKTGAKNIPLGWPALEVLSALSRVEGNPYVLPGRRPKSHFTAIETAWQRLRAAADLGDVRLHDLRHTYGSMGADLGESLHMIGRLLGHSSPDTTQRYAHLSADPRLAAADRISGRLAAAMGGKSGVAAALGKTEKPEITSDVLLY